jgi:quaternary ammonium compound-resistance protein SugE
MAWAFILLADVFEVAWPFVLKRAVGLSRWITSFTGGVLRHPYLSSIE